MKTRLAILTCGIFLAAPALAASIVNNDKEPRTIVVTEGGSQSQIVVNPDETVEFCATGCFVTMPNGDREALKGTEAVEISNGSAHFK